MKRYEQQCFFHRKVGQKHGQTFSLGVQEPINFCDGTIESDNGELVVCSVHNQVLTHDGQTDEAEVTTGSDPRRSADIDASQTGATVSP